MAPNWCSLKNGGTVKVYLSVRDGVSNHQPHNCSPNSLFRCRSKKTLKLPVTGLCEGNSLAIGEFPTQRASNVENVSIWWSHHVFSQLSLIWNMLCSVVLNHWGQAMLQQCIYTTEWVLTGSDDRFPPVWHLSFISVNANLTHWPLGHLDAILKLQLSISFYWLVSSHRLMIIPWDECHGTGNKPLPEPMLT